VPVSASQVWEELRQASFLVSQRALQALRALEEWQVQQTVSFLPWAVLLAQASSPSWESQPEAGGRASQGPPQAWYPGLEG